MPIVAFFLSVNLPQGPSLARDDTPLVVDVEQWSSWSEE